MMTGRGARHEPGLQGRRDQNTRGHEATEAATSWNRHKDEIALF